MKRGRHKHRTKNQRDSQSPAADFFHRLDGRIVRRHPGSVWLFTASTTTIASSTTSPIASTSPNSESVLMEKSQERKDHEGPDKRNRNRQQGDQCRPPSLEKNGRPDETLPCSLD